MKRILAILIAAILVLPVLSGMACAESALTDGTYSAEQQGFGGPDVQGKNQHSHHRDLGEYLYEKQPVERCHFFFAKIMVEVELMEAIDKGHQQDEPAIAFRNDGVIESRKQVQDTEQQGINQQHNSNPAIRDLHQRSEFLSWCEIHQSTAGDEFDTY